MILISSRRTQQHLQSRGRLIRSDKMNIVLLIAVMLTLSLAHGYNPCQQRADNNAYSRFVRRHIIQEFFDRSSPADWENYLRKYGLSDRPRQSFMELSDEIHVANICNGAGYPILPPQPGNLCMSSFHLLVYDLTVDNNGRITSLVPNVRVVIVACDVVVNQCLPVHFEGYWGQMPDWSARACMP